jgi:hypothetical protein
LIICKYWGEIGGDVTRVSWLKSQSERVVLNV